MFGRHSNTGTVTGNGLFQPNAQAVLITPGDQRGAGRRTHCGIGIGLQLPDAPLGQTVDSRGSDIGPAVATDIRIAHVVGENEHDVWATALADSRPKAGG